MHVREFVCHSLKSFIFMLTELKKHIYFNSGLQVKGENRFCQHRNIAQSSYAWNIPISLDINIPKYNKKVSGELYLLLGMSLDSASLRNQ